MTGVDEREALLRAVRERYEAGDVEERGRMAVRALGGAAVTMGLYGATAGVVLVSGVRMLRRRGLGWRRAVVEGGCWRSVGLLAVAHVAWTVVGRARLRRMAGGG